MSAQKPPFILPSESVRFLETSFSAQKGVVHDTDPKIVICDFLLFSVAYCTSDTEPDISYIHTHKRKPTLIIWDGTKDTLPNNKWYKFSSVGTRADIGILYVQNEYRRSWSESAKRAMTKWSAQSKYTLSEISLETYLTAYQKSTVISHIKHTFTKLLPVYERVYKGDFVCYGVIDTESSLCIAGLAVVYDKHTMQSKHISSFLLQNALKTSAGTALIAHWVAETKKQNLAYANFGILWKKGDPVSWKGYTKFKLHFGLERVTHRSPFVRIVW
jgi:hypothetical protein